MAIETKKINSFRSNTVINIGSKAIYLLSTEVFNWSTGGLYTYRELLSLDAECKLVAPPCLITLFQLLYCG